MNAFECLGLSAGFSIDGKALRAAFIKAQREYHPDHNPAGSNFSEQSNLAFEILKDELSRARHLLELQGVDERQYPLAPSDLMAWMELGEELEMGSSSSEIEALFLERDLQLQQLKSRIEAFDSFPLEKDQNALLAQWIQGESYRRRLRKIQKGEIEI